MANVQRNFIAGRMNKSLDERLVPNGEYTDALNVRLGSTELSEVGSVENSKGNTKLTDLVYINGVPLSSSAKCIGAFDDSARAIIYWFIHDPAFTLGSTGKLDMIVSFNVETGGLIYHIISIDNGLGQNTTLNFNPEFLITGINIIDELLFFTDNTNPPRVINVNRNYSNPVNNIDQFDSREILVVKGPPLSAPTVQLIKSNDEDTYLTDNFICFAYRYRYSNSEFSATSQFSQPAFLPSAFKFSPSSFSNDGMLNEFNACTVTFDSGSSLVKGIDILFKEANDPTIKVIQRIDKEEDSMPNNNPNQQITFDAAKIFSILPEAEILRLYDNVPTLAKAQTLMANRLVYGNYVEGYDLVDTLNQKTRLDFTALGVSTGLGENTVPTSLESSNFTAFSHSLAVSESKLVMDFTGITGELIVGSQITLDFTFEHTAWNGSSLPNETTPATTIGFTYILTQDFTADPDPLTSLITSTDFIAKFGTTTATIQTVANAQAGTGVTLTDKFNNALEAQLGSTSPQYDVNQTGITSSTPALPSAGEGIKIEKGTGDTLTMQILAAEYKENGGSNLIVEYFKITRANVSLQRISNTASLHSNRGYEVGIIYMDSFNRATTALVSDFNTVNFPCSASSTKNSINITIPPSQRAPRFATRYKFCIKADTDTYETIYSAIYFEDPNSNEVYFLLEGENIQKVNEGDRLIVKRDAAGPRQTCTTTTVLELAAKSADFIDPKDPNDPTIDIPVPAGTYMKLNNVNFAATMTNDNVIDVSEDPASAGQNHRYPLMAYPLFDTKTTFTNGNYDLPIGTKVVIEIEQIREGRNRSCELRTSIISHEFVCSQDYTTWEDFVNGENFEGVIENNAAVVPTVVTDGNNPVNNIFLNSVASATATKSTINNATDTQLFDATVFGGDTDSPSSRSDLNDNNYYRLYKNNSNNNYYLLVSGTRSCGGNSKGDSVVRVDVTVFRREAEIVFETEPKDTLPDLWFEGSQSFEVDSLGQHLGNVVNQNISQGVAGVVRTNFSNCFTFGNGVESYKIRDSVVGKQFNLGNRNFTTNNTTFQKAHRFADLTYSGVFNDETNVNKLNEFNLGLANFKPLEETFGDVEILFARRDDILVLQEDKISYVLAGKDLLTDADGTGQLTSVPSVLGKQIARIENYGISNNPESFAVWGESKYFTDAKRSAVIHLIGSSMANEQLNVISEAGMRSFFRDLFTSSFTTQKLGAYDPYMNEFVLTSNTILKPEVAKCTACGVTRNITIPAGQTFIYCVDLEPQEGTVVVRYELPLEGPQDIITEATSQDIITEGGDVIQTEGGVGVVGYTIKAYYNNIETTTGLVYASGTFTFEKDATTVNQVVIEITSTATVDDTIEVTVECPSGTLLNVYSVCLTDAVDAGKFIHNEASWSDGYLFSNVQSDLVTFGTGTGAFVISQYKAVVGNQGVGIIPTDNSVMTMSVNKIKFDDFVFDTANNSLGFVRSSTLYQNNITDITTLVGLETTIPINNLAAPDKYTGSFTVPAGGNHLYLIYDYRNPNRVTPTPPSPAVYDFTRYTQCQGPDTIVFRAATGYTFPTVARYEGVCYQKQTLVSAISSIDIPTGSETFVDCATCEAAAPPPTPASAPLLTTNSSSNVTSVSFTANGSLDTANGTVTSRGFYIGTNSSYISNTQYAVSGTALGNFSYNFAGATQGTTYYVTAYAVNEHGTGVGLTVSTTTTAVAYDYMEYKGCTDSTVTQIFRSLTTVPFPLVVKYNNVCYHDFSPTPTPTTVDVPSTQYSSCPLCEEQVVDDDDDTGDDGGGTGFDTETFTIQLCDGTGPSYIITINNIPLTGSVTKSSFVVNSSVRLNGNYGQPVSTYPEFDGDANYKITAIGTANPLVTLAYVAFVEDCSDWPTDDPPPPPQLYYRLIGCPKSSGSTPQDCYLLSATQPNADQRFVDGASGGGQGTNYNFYKYSGDQGLTYNGGVLCTNIQPVGTSTGCPPVPAPPPVGPPPTPTVYTQDIAIRECYTSGSVYYVRVTGLSSPTLSTGQALRLNGPSGPGGTPAMDGTKFWEITDNAATFYNTSVTVIAIESSCGGFTPPPVPPVPPTPPTIYGQYLDCDGGDAVAYVSGPSGTTFPNVLKISGICYEYSTLGGSTGADYTNYDDFTSCSLCQGTTPTPPTPPPSPPTPSCFAINNVSTGSSALSACNAFRSETMYFDASSLCQATAFYRTNDSCGSLAAATYVSDGSYSRQWFGNYFGSCELCQQV